MLEGLLRSKLKDMTVGELLCTGAIIYSCYEVSKGLVEAAAVIVDTCLKTNTQKVINRAIRNLDWKERIEYKIDKLDERMEYHTYGWDFEEENWD